MRPKRFRSWLNVPVNDEMREQVETMATNRGLAMAELVREILGDAILTMGRDKC